MQLLGELKREHEEIRAVLQCIETALQRIDGEDEPLNYEELAEAMYFMTQFRDIVHHNKEALLLRQLARRRRDLRERVRAFNRDHASLKADGVAFLELLEDAAEEAIVSKEAILSYGQRYIDAQRVYLARLEEQVFPLAEENLTKTDWQSLRRHLRRGHDANIEQVTQEQFESLYRHLAGDTQVSAAAFRSDH